MPPEPLPGLPGVTAERDLPCRMRDGVTLYADVYRPANGGPHPVLLISHPYDKSAAESNFGFSHPAWYARHGYVVVAQDTRGRYTSEGTFYPFRHEADDVTTTIEWARRDLTRVHRGPRPRGVVLPPGRVRARVRRLVGGVPRARHGQPPRRRRGGRRSRRRPGCHPRLVLRAPPRRVPAARLVRGRDAVAGASRRRAAGPLHLRPGPAGRVGGRTLVLRRAARTDGAVRPE